MHSVRLEISTELASEEDEDNDENKVAPVFYVIQS